MSRKERTFEVSEVMEHFKEKLTCADCEMCFGNICAGKFYGKELTEDDYNKPLCEGYDISLDSYMELEEEMHREIKDGRKFS